MIRLFHSKLFFAFALVKLCTGEASAQEIWANTFLLDAYIGSHRSSVASELRKGGYELSGGGYIDFRNWYSPKFPDATILFLNQVSPDFGIIWGFSTGESGEKYRISPAFQLGFVFQYVPFEDAILSISTVYPIFGNMTEETCRADYGSLGGVQEVNCRLAASIIPPKESLDYLVRIRGEADAKISIRFTLSF